MCLYLLQGVCLVAAFVQETVPRVGGDQRASGVCMVNWAHVGSGAVRGGCTKCMLHVRRWHFCTFEWYDSGLRIYLFQRWLQTHLCGEHFLCSSQVSEGSPWSGVPKSPPWHSDTEKDRVIRFYVELILTKSLLCWNQLQAAVHFPTTRCQAYIVVA